jgi:hypothetical protein
VRYPANVAIVQARLGRCDEAEAAAGEAERRLGQPGAERGGAEIVTRAWAAVGWCRLRWPKPNQRQP